MNLKEFLEESNIPKIHAQMRELLNNPAEFRKFWDYLDFSDKVRFIVKVGQYGGLQDFEKLLSLVKPPEEEYSSYEEWYESLSKEEEPEEVVLSEDDKRVIFLVKTLVQRAQFLRTINKFIKEGEK